MSKLEELRAEVAKVKAHGVKPVEEATTVETTTETTTTEAPTEAPAQ